MTLPALTLYGYWRSSATWRVRLGLHAKGIPYTVAPVHLMEGGGQQFSDAHRARNPLAQVPVLAWQEDGAPRSLCQSLAILEWLEERVPSPPLWPRDPYLRARARMLAEMINSGIQPLQNLSVMRSPLVSDGQAFARAAIERGLEALEAACADTAAAFLVGDAPTIADLCLAPQLYNARRFDLDPARWPRLHGAESRLAALPFFAPAHPDAQPDAP